jgi:hypothetical protein
MRRELEVADRSVNLPRLLEGLLDHLVTVVVAALELEQLAQGLGLDHLVAVERERADAVPLPLEDRNPQFDVPRLLVRRVLDELEVGLADAGVDVAAVAVVLDDLVGVLLVLGRLVGPAPGDEGEHPFGLVRLHLLGERPAAHGLVAEELDLADPDLRAILDVEGQVHQLRPARDLRDLVGHLGELEPLLRQHAPDDALHLLDEGRVDERVEADLRVFFLQLLVNLGLLDALGPDTPTILTLWRSSMV